MSVAATTNPISSTCFAKKCSIGKHVSIDPDKVEVRLDRGKAVSTLEIEIELPTPEKRRAAPAKASKTAKKRGKAA